MKIKRTPRMIASRSISRTQTSNNQIEPTSILNQTTENIDDLQSVQQKHHLKKSKLIAFFDTLKIRYHIPSPHTTLGLIFFSVFLTIFLHSSTVNSAYQFDSIGLSSQNMLQIVHIHQPSEIATLPKENSLYISKLNIFSEVTEGEYEEEKKYPLTWRRTHTSSPDRGGNTVIVGHRYKDNSPNYPLYNIDQIENGDDIVIYWDGEEYLYRVYNTTEVDETAIEIEDDTEEDILTLYACDWTGKKRLVVQASSVVSGK